MMHCHDIDNFISGPHSHRRSVMIRGKLSGDGVGGME